MTRKDYRLIAQAINRVYSQVEGETLAEYALQITAIRVLDWTINEIASAMEKDNPKFSNGMFVAACRHKEN